MVDLASILWISAFAFVLSLLLTPLVRDAFALRGWVDRPDGGRKFHERAVPRVGGIPIAVSYAAAFGVLLTISQSSGSVLENHLPLALSLLPCAGLIFATGLLDDLVGLRPWQKLAGHVERAVCTRHSKSAAYWQNPQPVHVKLPARSPSIWPPPRPLPIAGRRKASTRCGR